MFWPYPEGVTAEDEIAVVRFPGLTRDYTIDAMRKSSMPRLNRAMRGARD